MFLPNIPNVPGVPQVNRLNTKVAFLEPGNVISAAVIKVPYLQGILQASSSERWGIYDIDGNLILEPTTIMSIEDSSPSKVTTIKIEGGSFASYNKVQESEKYQVTMIKSGTFSELKDFKAQLRKLKQSTELLNVVTPEDTRLSSTLESFTNNRSTADGVNMIVFNTTWVEIREVSLAFSTTTIPTVAASTSRGKQQPQKPRSSLLFDAVGSLGG